MPTANMWVWQSVEELARIQIEYLKVWRMLKAGGNTGQRQGRETEAKPVFPPLRPMAAEAVEEEEISCVSGEGLAFAEASFDLSEFATVRLGLQVQNCSFYRTSLVKVLIENCSFAGCRFEGGYWQNVFAEESKFTGCDFNETVFKDTVFRRCLLQYANLNGSVLRQVVLTKPG